jgi:hypothetical protein
MRTTYSTIFVCESPGVMANTYPEWRELLRICGTPEEYNRDNGCIIDYNGRLTFTLIDGVWYVGFPLTSTKCGTIPGLTPYQPENRGV